MRRTDEQRTRCSGAQEQVAGSVAPPYRSEGGLAREVARLVLHVQVDAEQIATKVKHVVETRHLPQDLLRNTEILEDHATRLQTHARQIIRRLLGEIHR